MTSSDSDSKMCVTVSCWLLYIYIPHYVSSLENRMGHMAMARETGQDIK